jgi:hypothetical protein
MLSVLLQLAPDAYGVTPAQLLGFQPEDALDRSLGMTIPPPEKTEETKD